MSRLKSCPFCGGEARVESDPDCDGGDYRTVCTKCEIGVPDCWYSIESDAIAAWNRRGSKSVTEIAEYALAVPRIAARFQDLLDSVRELRMDIYACKFSGPNDCSNEPMRIVCALARIIAEAEKEAK